MHSTIDSPDHIVLVNEEGQYSLWPQHKAIPQGWDHAGFSGTREECLAHVDQVWTDMRPKSLIAQMGG